MADVALVFGLEPKNFLEEAPAVVEAEGGAGAAAGPQLEGDSMYVVPVRWS